MYMHVQSNETHKQYHNKYRLYVGLQKSNLN